MRRALLWLAVAAVAAGTGVTASGADFTTASSSPGNTFAAAADFNTVSVSLTDPGATLRGTVALQASASSERGIAQVRFQTSPAGAGTWTNACTDTQAPFTCDYDTAGVADGVRDLRAIAVDQAGYERISAVVASRRIDNTLPTVTLSDPGAYLTGTETLTSTASDAGSGLASLAIAYRPAGGSWTTLCSGSTSPRACALSTTTLADGAYELRGRATDAAGNVADFALTRTVDNTAPAVSIPVTVLRGTDAVAAMTAADGAGSGIASVTAQFRQVGSSTWSDVCIDTEAPYECAGLDTTQYPDALYEARAIAVDKAGFSTTSATQTVRIDNTVPSIVTLVNPGSSLSGNVSLSGTAADVGSGIASWTVQHRLTGSGTWNDACSDSATPYACSWATTSVADGLYDLRALALDKAGNTTGSNPLTSIRVDNVAPVVSLADPGSPLTGTVSLQATATDGGGIASVVIERSAAGANSWTAVCTDSSAPFACAFDAEDVNEGSYDFRARATDRAGRTATSAVVAARVVDHAPVGTDIQATNGGSNPGRLEGGDILRLSFSEPMAPASILTGWTGGSQAIRVAIANGSTTDTMDFLTSNGASRLNLVNGATGLNLGADFVSSATTFNATMTMSGSTVTITLGSRITGTVKTAAIGRMTWRPSALAKDVAGNAASTAQVTESGTNDRDF